jgi:hypothetical protein
MSNGTDPGHDGKPVEPGSGTEGSERAKHSERPGRPIMIGLFVGGVVLAGGFGYFIGSIGIRALDPIGAFGITLFQPTPIGMALYGMIVVGGLLGVLFSIVIIAARSEKRASSENG